MTEHKIVAVGTGEEIREYVHVRDAARLSVQILGDEFRNEHVVLTGHHSLRFGDLLAMIQEIVGDVDIVMTDPDPEDERHGNSGHFFVTPYSFTPKVAKKLVANPYCDIGQGLVECLEEVHREAAGAHPPEVEPEIARAPSDH
jgi:UDP-glucose 4-epimerase